MKIVVDKKNSKEIINVNFMNSKKTDIVGRKIWKNGPDEKPTIELQLYRNLIPYLEPVELKNGETSYTWKDLPAKDSDGQ